VPAGLGGLRGVIEIILPEEVATFPAISEGILLNDPITFVDGGGPRTWHCTKGTGLVKSDSVGGKGGNLFRNSITFTVPGNSPDLLHQVSALLGKRIMAISTDTAGQRRLVGTPLRLATIRPRHSTGNSRNDRPGAEFEIEAYAPHPALIYQSDLLPFSTSDYAYTPL